MERIEVPATAYWQSKDGKRFSYQEDCEKWELLSPKWTNPVRYREFENEEGQLCYAFWAESKEDLEDILWFIDHKLYVCTRNRVGVLDSHAGALDSQPQWIVIRPFYDGYNSDYEAITMKEYRELLDETLKAVQDTMSEIVKMIWEKA